MYQLIMKTLSVAFLASLITTIEGRQLATGAEIEARWHMDLPVVTYNQEENRFYLDYGNTNFSNGNGMQSDFSLPFGGSNGGGDAPVQMDGEGGALPILSFEVDPSTIKDDPDIYQFVTPEMQADPANGYEIGDVGFGVMRMMVRSSIGLESAGGGFLEVNFIETIIKLRYDLTANVSVPVDIAVRAKNEAVKAEDPLFAEAWLCDLSDTESLTNPDRTLPKRITSYDPDTGTARMTQGELITVCVAPDDGTYSEGFIMSDIADFTWQRDTPLLQQEAIFNSMPSANSLTLYTPLNCNGAEFCHFQSILMAGFFGSAGEVVGSGSVIFEIKSNRRLGGTSDGERRRRLQNDAEKSSFEIGFNVGNADEGPGALMTASGSSFGFFTSTIFAGILAAHLLT